MTQKIQIEILQKSFPSLGETEARERLNVANSRFVRESRIIQGAGYEDTVANQLLYPFSSFTNSAGGHVIEVRDVAVEDTDSDVLLWYIHDDNEQIALGIEDSCGELQALSTAGKQIEVVGVFNDPDYGTDLTATPTYDEEFHMAIVYKVLADLHLEAGNIGMNDRYEMKYKDSLVEAKRAAGGRGLKGNYRTFTSAGQD